MTSAQASPSPSGHPGDGPPRVAAIAHRGDPTRYRENTIASVRAAIAAGADIVEIDVKTTADAVSVVLHDDTLRRLWGDRRRVADLTAAQVERIGLDGAETPVEPTETADRAEHGIPTLSAMLDLFADPPGSAAVMIDMDGPQFADAAIEVVRGHRIDPGRVLWCGHPEGMRRVRQALPTARIVMSWGPENATLPADGLVAELRPELFNPQWTMIDDDLLAWARRHELGLSCWTVDLDFVMRAMAAQPQVRAIISNQVATLIEVLGAVGRR